MSIFLLLFFTVSIPCTVYMFGCMPFVAKYISMYFNALWHVIARYCTPSLWRNHPLWRTLTSQVDCPPQISSYWSAHCITSRACGITDRLLAVIPTTGEPRCQLPQWRTIYQCCMKEVLCLSFHVSSVTNYPSVQQLQLTWCHHHFIIIIYLFIKHIHIDGREQDSGTGQQGTHCTLTVGLHKACNYCQTSAIKSIRYTLQIC